MLKTGKMTSLQAYIMRSLLMKEYNPLSSMHGFFNKLYFNNLKCQSIGTVREDNYKGVLLFTINFFVSFGKYC